MDPAVPIERCSRKEAVDSLESAEGECLDTAITALEERDDGNLAAAYLLRAKRNGNPRDLLNALRAAGGGQPFNRALAQEGLGLFDQAIQSWNEAAATAQAEWAAEAAAQRDGLRARILRQRRWHQDLENALQRRDRAALRKLVKPAPSVAMRHFEASDLYDRERARLLASVLAETGDRYALDVLDAMERAQDRNALKEGIEAFQAGLKGDDPQAYARAASLLERLHHPLALSARYGIATTSFTSGGEPLALLESIRVPPEYRDLSARLHVMRALALEYGDAYLHARGAYDTAMKFAAGDASATAAILLRRSSNFLVLGNAEAALREALKALVLLPEVPRNMDESRIYDAAANATQELGELPVALLYREASLAAVSRPPVDQKYLSGAYARRAETLLAMGRRAEAVRDLRNAADAAEAVGDLTKRALQKMRIDEVEAQFLLSTNPQAAVEKLTAAMQLAAAQDSSHRVVLRYKRALARRAAGDPAAEEDMVDALQILRDEAEGLLQKLSRGDFESERSHYFGRFDAMQRELIVRRIEANDAEGAFVYAEQTRAFEPMHLLLHTAPAPRGFVRIENAADIARSRARLPADTVILQYLVLDDQTYVWVLTNARLRLVSLRVSRASIQRWTRETDDAVRKGQWPKIEGTMRVVHEQLVEPALKEAPGRNRIVFVPDRPMHALPFAALNDGKQFLIERANIAFAGSTSLYLYALERDRELASENDPTALIVGNPRIDARLHLQTLQGAEAEALALKTHLYKDAELLTGAEATTRRFLDAAKHASIIHFAGHGIANAAMPWTSRLVLAPDGGDRGELTARKLLTEVHDLPKTRLIVLAACSTASGQSIGPEGVAPLVRPLIAARVPAVVGTLAEVNDATVKDLLVSLHCHYRTGDDVAVALQNAQRAMLRKHKSVGSWALFQVVGHAASPFPRPETLEEHDELAPCENLLYRPDGLRPQ